MSNLMLLLHPVFGVLAILTAVWLIVDTLQFNGANAGRIWKVSLIVAVLVWLSYLVGGYWYVVNYAADKAVILKGPWKFAHGFFMETKEHVFFILLLLGSFLPIAARNDLANKANRKLVIWAASLVVVLGLSMESFGAFISMGVKLGLMPH